MGASQATALEAELEQIVVAGLWDVDADRIGQLRSLSIFGGTPDEPAPLHTFRTAFRKFLKNNDELAGALSEMALRLYGAEQPWRENNQEGRQAAFGEVEWRGKVNAPGTTRRRDGQRRREMRDLLTKAILTAETGQPAETPLPADLSDAPTDGLTDTDHDAPQPLREPSPQPLREPSPQQPSRLQLSRRVVILAALGLVVSVVAIGFATGLWPKSSAGPQTAGRQFAHSQSRGRQPTPEPIPNRDASCASLAADTQAHTSSTEFVDSPGQLGAGELLVGRIVPNGKYSHLLEVNRGDIVEISIALHDDEYTSVSDVVVAVAAAPERPRCTRLMGLARSTSSPSDRAELGPLTLKSASNTPPRITYLPGSTRLLTENGHQIAHLSDGVMKQGTAIPFQIPAGRTDYFVNFRIKIE
ncbi:MAG TPA: hypothetical protein VGF95_04115 [Solirubrobacteraceae bacterium]